MKLNAIMIEQEDNVAVAIETLSPGEYASYQLPDGTCHTTLICSEVPIYHKFAVRAIPAGTKVMKYGEHIGEAAQDISEGEHVHVHNITSVRETLVP
jgi:altronate dehydratase small subunit